MTAILRLTPPHVDETSFCVARKLLASIDPQGKVAPCSFAPHVTHWRPGKLREILNSIRNAAPPREAGCPYL